MIDTRALAEAIERAEIGGRRKCVDAARQIAAQLGAEIIEIAGGVAPFVGAGSPLSEAAGLGLFAEVSAGDISRLTDFYATHRTPPRIAVSAVAPLELSRLLARSGFWPVELQNVLAADLGSAAFARDDRIAEGIDPWVWGRASAAGFVAREPTEDEVLVGAIIGAIPSVTKLQVVLEGSIAATAAMDVEGELAALFAASTAPAARVQGWQTALIRDRVARARERGARHAHAAAGVATRSERNFRRLGFQVLYTRTVWERPLGG